jgi:hypothetical protein
LVNSVEASAAVAVAAGEQHGVARVAELDDWLAVAIGVELALGSFGIGVHVVDLLSGI